MNETMVVSPAYGRDYNNKSQAVQHWRAGKDFILENITSKWVGKPCSNRDFDAGTRIEIRYNQKQDLVVVNN